MKGINLIIIATMLIGISGAINLYPGNSAVYSNNGLEGNWILTFTNGSTINFNSLANFTLIVPSISTTTLTTTVTSSTSTTSTTLSTTSTATVTSLSTTTSTTSTSTTTISASTTTSTTSTTVTSATTSIQPSNIQSANQLNLVENITCTREESIILNNPSLNALIIEKPCPKWNYINSVNPSYNSLFILTNSTLNFSLTFNQIPTAPIIANLSKSPVGTLNSLNVSKSNMNIGYYDKVRGIYIGYPDYKVNRTFIPGQNATWQYVNISVHVLNWSLLAINWNTIINSYEKNVIPLCQKNATWTEGNITYCAKLKGTNASDIRTLCALQDILDHNITQVLPNCVLNAITGSKTYYSSAYTNAQPYISTYIHPDAKISNLTIENNNYKNGALYGVVIAVIFTAMIIIALALSGWGRQGGRIGRRKD